MDRKMFVHRLLRHGLWSCTLGVAACIAPAQTAQPDPGAAVVIDTGKVAGTLLDNGVLAYIGIPFAAPPIGELRWHEPVAAKPWTGVYAATTPKPGCAQRAPANRTPGAFSEDYSEDCLYLNVWTPPAAKPGAKLPVVVWIYGGGFTGGSANMPGYSTMHLAEKGVITVNLAYRVGIFGYFAHPELTKESGHNASGDWGSLDQIAGLKWVQRNIDKFGGDPANVTVIGQSAGSESIYQLQASPLARGLFTKLSPWSGADLAPGGQVPKSLAEGEAIGTKVQQILGAKNLADMRAMSTDQIFNALSQQTAGAGNAIQTRPIVDGYFLPNTPHEIFVAGKQNDVPLYTSSTGQDLGSAIQFYDGVHTVADLQKVAASTFGDSADQFLKLFPAATDEDARKVARIVAGDSGFGISNRDWAHDQALYGKQPVYLAQWAHEPPPNKPGIPNRSMFGDGPSHGSDIAYWLGTYVANSNKEWTDWDKALSDKMQDTVIAFAKTGNPSTAAVNVPRYDLKNEQRVVFGDSIHIEKLNTEQIEFLRAHIARRSGNAPAVAPAPGNPPGR